MSQRAVSNHPYLSKLSAKHLQKKNEQLSGHATCLPDADWLESLDRFGHAWVAVQAVSYVSADGSHNQEETTPCLEQKLWLPASPHQHKH